jgi:putative sporulation protein YtaF
MHEIVGIIILSVVSSLDNFAVGLSYAVNKKIISIISNSCLSVTNAITTLITMILGNKISNYIDADIATTIGASIFIVLGLIDITKFLLPLFVSLCRQASKKKLSLDENEGSSESLLIKNNKKHSSSSFSSSSFSSSETTIIQSIGWKELILLAFGLSFTNIASGIAAGFAGYPIVPVVLLVLISSFVLCIMGQLIGRCFGSIIDEQYVSLISGCVLLFVGLDNIPYLDKK